MGISVCIPTYNTLALTRKCLDSLLRTGAGLLDEVIVVDDLSTDGTREYLATLRPPFKIILNDARRGYARNNNLAVRQARNEIVCLLNADTVLRPRWARPMLDVFDSAATVGMVGNIQWNPQTGRFDHMGIYWTDDLVPKHFGKEWWFVPFPGARQWPAVSAACCMIRKDVFLAAGGFDEGYRNGYEDIDLCLRLGRQGFRHLVVGQSRIHHRVSSSPGRHDNDQQNRSRFLSRWGQTLQGNSSWRMTMLDGINYLVRYADRPWRYNGAKLITAWKNATRPDPTVSLPKLWPYG